MLKSILSLAFLAQMSASQFVEGDKIPAFYSKDFLILNEKCPTNYVLSQNLTTANLDTYLGRWYSLAYTRNPYMRAEDFCPTANYSYDPEDPTQQTILVDNSFIWHDNRTRGDVIGHAYYVQPGNLQVNFFNDPRPEVSLGNYQIFDLDADHSYVFSCHDWFNPQIKSYQSQPIFWLLTRDWRNQQNGVSTQDRIEYALKWYKQAGASIDAMNQVRKAFMKFNFWACPKNNDYDTLLDGLDDTMIEDLMETGN